MNGQTEYQTKPQTDKQANNFISESGWYLVGKIS